MNNQDPVSERSSGWGYLHVAAAAILWASSGSVSKFLFNIGLPPSQLVQLRVTLASALLLPCLLLWAPGLLKIKRRDLLYFILLGSAGMAALQYTYLAAISKIHVAAAILLQDLAPVLIVCHTALFAREKVKWPVILAVMAATFGCYLVVGAYNVDMLSMNRSGIVIGLLSACAFAVYSVMGEYGMRRYHPVTILFFALLFAAVIWNIFLPPFEAFTHDYSRLQWIWIFYIAVLGTILPFGLYFKGVNLIRSTRASITATLEPITAGIFSCIFLHEYLGPLQLLGGGLVIAAIVILQLRQENDTRTPEFIRTHQA